MIIPPLVYALSVTVLPPGSWLPLCKRHLLSFSDGQITKGLIVTEKGSFHVYSEFGIAWNKWELVDKVGSGRQRHGCVRRDKDHGCGCAQ